MQQIIDRELNRARIAGSVSAGKRFHPTEDIHDLIHTVKILYREKNLEIESFIHSPDHLPFEQDDIQELIGNLLDNAAKWARHKIILSIDVTPSLTLIIEDDGPGIEPHLADNLLSRGRRLDEQTPGHGLGLSIVQEIVKLYDGHISFDQSRILGGTAITIELPIATDC